MTMIMIPSYLSLTSMHRACQISVVSFLQWTLIYRTPSSLSAFRSNPLTLFKCLPRNIKPRILHHGKYNRTNKTKYNRTNGASPVFPKPLSVDLIPQNLVTVAVLHSRRMNSADLTSFTRPDLSDNFLSNNELTSWQVNLRAIIELEILFRKRNYRLEYGRTLNTNWVSKQILWYLRR